MLMLTFVVNFTATYRKQNLAAAVLGRRLMCFRHISTALTEKIFFKIVERIVSVQLTAFV